MTRLRIRKLKKAIRVSDYLPCYFFFRLARSILQKYSDYKLSF